MNGFLNKINRQSIKARKFLATDTFFKFLVIVFIIQGSWVAVSSIYPMAFDEEVHLGIIRFFASNPNPFFSVQPIELDQFGPIVHETSYLYRYIMTLPWHFISFATDNFMAQVIFMRLINVGLFAAGLVVFRKVLLIAKAGASVANLTLLLVVLTPVSSQLAGQINYDNLVVLLVPSLVMYALKATGSLSKKQIDVSSLMMFFSMGFIGSIVKFTFVPIFAAALLFVMWQIFMVFKSDITLLVKNILAGFKQIAAYKKLFLLAVLLLSFGLFFQRYSTNVVLYGTSTPTCVDVIGENRCEANSIYRRGIIYEQSVPDQYDKSPVTFAYKWLRHMLVNLMSVLNGPDSGYSIGRALFFPFMGSVILSVSGLLLFILFWRRLIKNDLVKITLLIALTYVGLLFIKNYSSYLDVGRRVAVQGRYLVPLLPLFYFVFILAISKVLNHLPKLRLAITTFIIICFAWGGGALTFILHSDHAWYWPNAAINQMNDSAQKVLRPLVPDSQYTPYWRSSREF